MADDTSGQLTPEQRDKAIAWVNQHFKAPQQCPVCTSSNWVVGDRLWAPNIFRSDGGLSIGGTAMPLLVLTCTTCGYTHFLNAVLAGLLPKPSGGGGSNAT